MILRRGGATHHAVSVRQAVQRAESVGRPRQQLHGMALVPLCEPPEHDHLIVSRKTPMAGVDCPLLLGMTGSGISLLRLAKKAKLIRKILDLRARLGENS
jgi:hypothetical protein